MFDLAEAVDRIIDRVMQATQADRPDILRDILSYIQDDDIEDTYREVVGGDPPEQEDDEPTEPEEGDFVTEDHVTFREYSGRGTIRVPAGEPWRRYLKGRMNLDHYWPNVWFLSDHGNYHLLSLEDK